MMPEWEFRLTKVENLLAALTERQVQQQLEISQLQESQRRTDEQIQTTTRQIQSVGQQVQAIGHDVQAIGHQAQAAAGQIQTLAQHVDLVFSALGRVSDSQERTEVRLQFLIDAVDRLRPEGK